MDEGRPGLFTRFYIKAHFWLCMGLGVYFAVTGVRAAYEAQWPLAKGDLIWVVTAVAWAYLFRWLTKPVMQP
jgi:hypothetical protein